MKQTLLKLKEYLKKLFSDNNNINEKSIVGFMAFGMMVFTLSVDIITGLLGKPFPIHEFVYEGFMYIAIGALGIASVDKIFGKNAKNEYPIPHDEYPNEGEHGDGCHDHGGHHHHNDNHCGDCN